MTNFDISEKWSSLQFGALMRKISLNALRIIFYSFLKIIDCKYIYLNGYQNNFHLMDHAVFMTDHCDTCNYAWRTSNRTAVIKSNFWTCVLSDFGKFKNENYVKMFIWSINWTLWNVITTRTAARRQNSAFTIKLVKNKSLVISSLFFTHLFLTSGTILVTGWIR